MHPLPAFTLSLALALTATQGAALSCMAPDPVLTFQTVNAAPEPWVVLLGRLSYSGEPKIPDRVVMQSPSRPVLAPVAAQFSGMGLSAGGFDRPFAGAVLMQTVCYGPWCGGYPGRSDVMIFARVQPDGSYVLDLDPCGQHVFDAPSTAVVAILTACMAGRDCAAK